MDCAPGRWWYFGVVLALAAMVTSPARGERLLGFGFVDEVIFKLDTETGELIKFFGHPVFNLGGLDIDSQGNLYYMGNNTLWRIDLDQPSNDQFIGSVPKVIFESFEVINDVGYTGEVFTGTFYSINLLNGVATPIGQYGGGGVDRITGLASTDYPGSAEPLHVYGQRVFLDDIIEVDIVTGENLGVVVADPALSTTNLAYGAEGYWFIDGDKTLFNISVTDGVAVPVLEDIDVSGVDGLTVVFPEPVIATESLPDGVVDVAYGPVPLEVTGGGPGVLWVALSEGYQEIDLGESQFSLVGVRQGLNGDDVAMAYAMPFAFPYYGQSYNTVYVCNNGFIDLDGPFTNPNNSSEELKGSNRIAPLWDNLRTDFGNRDVHIDTTVPGQVTFRWDVVENADMGVCNFSCTLKESGVIQFDYGLPNSSITPTVGISAGDGVRFIISDYSNQPSLHTADSLRYEPQEGLPPGMVLTAAGVLQGIPTEVGEYTARIRLTDSLGGYDERDLPLAILAEPACAADVSGAVPGVGDGTVDVQDLVYMILEWGPGGDADITGPGGVPDGVVDVQDLVAVILAWGPC